MRRVDSDLVTTFQLSYFRSPDVSTERERLLPRPEGESQYSNKPKSISIHNWLILYYVDNYVFGLLFEVKKQKKAIRLT